LPEFIKSDGKNADAQARQKTLRQYHEPECLLLPPVMKMLANMGKVFFSPVS
jgi:hypothetical protein